MDVSREIAACIARFWKARGVDPTLDALLVYAFVSTTCVQRADEANGGRSPVLAACPRQRRGRSAAHHVLCHRAGKPATLCLPNVRPGRRKKGSALAVTSRLTGRAPARFVRSPGRSYLSEFLNEELLMGEEGYALATLQTALAMLERFAIEGPVKPRTASAAPSV